MIEVYKLGREFYKDGVDKNGGLYEAHLITDACADIKTRKNVLVIINGVATKDDREHLDFLFDNMDLKIFIATDPCFKDNIDIVNQCDYLLHQAGNEKAFIEYCRDTLGVKSNMRYAYSYVPNLFYKYTYIPFAKISPVIFGGGHIDERVLEEYGKQYPMELYTRNSKGDARIPYNDFINLLSEYKFALIISRNEYIPFGWVTPRYYEALSVHTIPILDPRYDNTNQLDAECVKLNSVDEFGSFCRTLDQHHDLCRVIHDKLNKDAELNRYAFIELMTAIVGAL